MPAPIHAAMGMRPGTNEDAALTQVAILILGVKGAPHEGFAKTPFVVLARMLLQKTIEGRLATIETVPDMLFS